MSAGRQQIRYTPLPARTVARAMCRYLETNNTSIHWVQVVGESSLEPVPMKMWPVQDNAMFNVMVQDGWSEGMLLYVYAQKDRTKPQEVTPLLQIKMLCNRQQLGLELPIILTFIDQIEGFYKEDLASEDAPVNTASAVAHTG